MSSSHTAALLSQKGGPLAVASRPTPTPGPDEVLVAVKAVALNPIDNMQRATLFSLPIVPAVLGCDVAGVVVASGANVSSSLGLVEGTRVCAMASSFYQAGSPDHGAFQSLVLVQKETVVPLPDGISFEHGAMMPLAALTAFTAWTTIGISLSARHAPGSGPAVLVWGAASSVGSFAVQTAKLLGLTVYATASPRHHAYIKSLGAHAVFDYKAADAIDQIVAAVQADGRSMALAHAVVPGSLQPVLDVLQQTRGADHALVAHSPPLLDGHPTMEDATVIFNLPTPDVKARNAHFHQVFHEQLGPALQDGSLVPSPAAQVESGGLSGLDAALDKLQAGVSGKKLVLVL